MVANLNTFYGVTGEGGKFNAGTVFKFSPSTGKEALIYSFPGGSNGYGPYGGLINLNGELFSSALAINGNSENGIFFKVNPLTGVQSTVYELGSHSGDGTAECYGNLIANDGFIYGTCQGGAKSGGSVIKIDASTGAETVLYSFGATNTDLGEPFNGLTYVNGFLYGGAGGGGAHGLGGIFRMDPTTGAIKILYSFLPHSGNPRNPSGALVSVGGVLYGAASGGGRQQAGEIFSFNPATSVLTDLHDFGGGDGDAPLGLIYAQGAFYGTTYSGAGSGKYGTVFKLTLR